MMEIFDRIVCGVAPNGVGMEALRQAKRLLAPGGRLVAVTVHDWSAAIHAGWDYAALAATLAEEAESARAKARTELEEIGNSAARLVEGSPFERIIEEAEREQATLIAVGTHGHRRLPGILLGSVATRLLHDAPCPVLVARPVPDVDRFPRSIVVGVDGSPPSLEALDVAHALTVRLDAAIRPLAVAGEKPVDIDRLRTVSGLKWNDEAEPVDALVAASAHSDLVVVGSRGLHGLRSLGSVSERVAHKAACSVLVVRPLVHGGRAGRAFADVPAHVR